MKRIVLSAIALLCMNAMFAQRSNVQFGLKSGVNFANLKDDANSNTDARTGFYIGGLAHIHLSKTFALQPEIVYSTQGAEYGSGARQKINYVNIPVLAQYMIGDGFRLQTGPQLGLMTAAEFERGNIDVDVDNSVRSADLSWSFGASYITPIGIGFDGRYNLGITDISKNNSDLRNRVWQLGLFYQFAH